MKSVTPVLLLILDGWGVRSQKEHNAIAQAKTPVMDRLIKDNPSTLLDASGPAVGLPKKIFGNSEVGHLTIGAGRIIDSHQTRIDRSIVDKSFFKNKQFLAAIAHAKKKKGCVHLVGLLSDKGVHSHQEHLFALLKLCKEKKVYPIVHVILDGRDTPPASAKKYLKRLYKEFKTLGTGGIGSVSGRYFAMDRDRRWDRTQAAHEVMMGGFGHFLCDDSSYSVLGMIDHFYKRGITDEFVPPFLTGRFGLADQSIKSGDSLIFFNFREDRARQLAHAFADNRFTYFKRKKVKDLHICTFTSYDHTLDVPVAYPLIAVKNPLGEVYAKRKLKQVRIAETEKYAHVTYFFNSLRQKPFPLEKRILIDSPKVSTYDKRPAMKAKEITKVALDQINQLKRSGVKLLVVNFANADMVGHTGNFKAAIKACEVEDTCVGTLVEAMTLVGGIVVITADHGNAETMDPSYQTSHTFANVPFIICGSDLRKKRLKKGGLSHVAPTLLDLAGIPIPKEMTAKSLLT